MRLLAEQVEQVEQGAPDALNCFWNEMAQRGTPLVEPDPDDPTRCLVTFLWRETKPAEAIIVRELVSWRTDEQRRMTKLPGTDVWYLSWWFHSDIRTTYGFVVRRPSIDGASAADWRTLPQEPDPLCHHRQPDDWQDVASETDLVADSILVLPDAEPLPWLERRDGVPTGSVSEHTFASALLGNERRVWVYQPANRSTGDQPVGFMVVFDGVRHHSATTIIDNLIADGAIPPLAAIFVDQLDLRSYELTCNPTFSQVVVDELVPWARATFNLSNDSNQTIITGRSFGGLCSAYTALKYPGVFGNVLMQSGSCWYHPSLILGYRSSSAYEPNEIVGTPIETPTILTEYAASPPVPIRIYQEVGTHELGPPPTRWWQIFASRHFRDLVQAKGYALTYREFSGGHDDAWWRGTLADGLIDLTSQWRQEG